MLDAISSLIITDTLAVGLHDRGVIAEGFKADLNLIDYNGLRLYAPWVRFDLPAGGKRLVQPVDGYVATIVSGQVVMQSGIPTGAKPGRLIRGPQPDPQMAEPIAAE